MTVPDALQPLRLRPAAAGDEPFLFALYAGTRQAEVAAWGWDTALRDAFLRQQFAAQQQGYRAEFPTAAHWIVEAAGRPVGRLLLHTGADEIRVVDIALLPAAQGQGLGTRLLRGVLAAGAHRGRPVRLHVRVGNPARRLYERLGFVARADNGLDVLMEWEPPTGGAPLEGELSRDDAELDALGGGP